MTDKPKPKLEEIELRSDGWERFERAIDVAVRTPARRRVTPIPKPKERPASNGRAHKGRTRN